MRARVRRAVALRTCCRPPSWWCSDAPCGVTCGPGVAISRPTLPAGSPRTRGQGKRWNGVAATGDATLTWAGRSRSPSRRRARRPRVASLRCLASSVGAPCLRSRRLRSTHSRGEEADLRQRRLQLLFGVLTGHLLRRQLPRCVHNAGSHLLRRNASAVSVTPLSQGKGGCCSVERCTNAPSSALTCNSWASRAARHRSDMTGCRPLPPRAISSTSRHLTRRTSTFRSICMIMRSASMGGHHGASDTEC